MSVDFDADVHVCPQNRPCTYCLVRDGGAVPSNVYVFPRGKVVPGHSAIPLTDDVIFQMYLRLPAFAKRLVAALIVSLARGVEL